MARPVAISRDHILEAAAAEFAARGFGNTSLRQLMAAANVSTTAFYARYRSKEAVLIALVEQMMGELFAEGAAALAAARDVEAGIEAGLGVLVSVLRRHRQVVALALTEGAAIAEVSEALGDALAALAGLLASRIAASRGSRRRNRADRARAWALVGALHLQVLRWSVFGQLEDVELEPELLGAARALLGDES